MPGWVSTLVTCKDVGHLQTGVDQRPGTEYVYFNRLHSALGYQTPNECKAATGKEAMANVA